MDRFPSEFAELLNGRGQRLLARPPRFEVFHRRRATPIVVFDDLIDARVARQCIGLLDRVMYPRLLRMAAPIPREWIASMKENYTDALKKLADTPLTVVALVNSLQRVGEAQLASAGIRGYFERVISADAVRALKPAPQPYLAVAQAYDVAAADVRLVAAHSWDVSGALAAGCKAAFVARPGMVLSPIGRQPDIMGPDISAVVDQIIDTDAQ